MGKIPKQSYFLNTKYADLRFGHFEANLLAYIFQFEANKLYCFASRKHIAEALLVSETRVQDAIKRLVQAKAITVKRVGRKRILFTNPDRHKGIEIQPGKGSESDPKGIGIQPDEGSESDISRDRNPTNTKISVLRSNLLRSNLPRSNLIRSNKEPTKINLDPDWNPFE